jgi:hypothetical protein
MRRYIVTILSGTHQLTYGRLLSGRTGRRLTSTIVPLQPQPGDNIPRVKNYINGQFEDSVSDRWIPLRNPATQGDTHDYSVFLMSQYNYFLSSFVQQLNNSKPSLYVL